MIKIYLLVEVQIDHVDGCVATSTTLRKFLMRSSRLVFAMYIVNLSFRWPIFMQ